MLQAPILPRIAAGDVDAVGACLDEYGGMVLGLARRYLEPLGGDVEDSVQEIFVEVWRCAARYDPRLGSEASFIATIAHRRLIDAQRRMGSRLHLHEGVEPKPVKHEPAHGPVMAEDLRRAAVALTRLDADERHVLELALHRGLSHSRIAAATGVPVGTVKTRLRRGLMRLREIIGGSSILRALTKGGGQ